MAAQRIPGILVTWLSQGVRPEVIGCQLIGILFKQMSGKLPVDVNQTSCPPKARV